MHSKSSTTLFILLIFFGALFFSQAASATEPEGFDRLRKACEKAQTDQRLVLLKFGAEWCPWCVDMRKIFSHPKLAKVLKRYEVLEFDVGARTVIDGKKTYANFFGLMMKYAQKAFIPQLFIIRPNGTLLARLNPDAYESKKTKGNDPIKLARILASYLPAPRRAPGGTRER